MSKHPPATDATPEDLVRALARRGPSSLGTASGRTGPDGGTSAEASAEYQEAPATSGQEARSRPVLPRDALDEFLERHIPVERREELRRAVVEVDGAIRERRPLDPERFR